MYFNFTKHKPACTWVGGATTIPTDPLRWQVYIASCTVVSNIWAGNGKNTKDPLADKSSIPGTWNFK